MKMKTPTIEGFHDTKIAFTDSCNPLYAALRLHHSIKLDRNKIVNMMRDHFGVQTNEQLFGLLQANFVERMKFHGSRSDLGFAENEIKKRALLDAAKGAERFAWHDPKAIAAFYKKICATTGQTPRPEYCEL